MFESVHTYIGLKSDDTYHVVSYIFYQIKFIRKRRYEKRNKKRRRDQKRIEERGKEKKEREQKRRGRKGVEES